MDKVITMPNCPLCGVMLLEKNLARHLRKVHQTQIQKKGEAKSNPTRVTKTVYKCTTCKKIVSESQFRRHLKESHEYIPKASTKLIGIYFEKAEVSTTHKRKTKPRKTPPKAPTRAEEINRFKKSTEQMDDKITNVQIGMGLESTTNITKVLRQDVTYDTRTRKDNFSDMGKGIIFVPGWSLKDE